MQQPTGQPGWPTPQPQPIPPRHRRSWPQRLAILVCAAVGLMVGGMVGTLGTLIDFGVGTVLMLVGMWLGLTLGIMFGFWVTRPKVRQPIDPARYPNQLFRRV